MELHRARNSWIVPLKRLVSILTAALLLVGCGMVTQLTMDAKNGDTTAMQNKIAKGADVNERTSYGYTALHAASANGQLDAAAFLIERGADVNAASKNGITPLINAANRGDERMVRLFLEKGADPTAACSVGYTAADYALKQGHRSLADLLRNEEKKKRTGTGDKP